MLNFNYKQLIAGNLLFYLNSLVIAL